LEKVRVIVADDHPGFPEIVEGLLKSEFQIVGKVTDGEALVKETMKLNPDIVVTDISMPVLNGIEAAERLKELGCTSRLVFLTVHADWDFIRTCMSAGAFGYVVKSRVASELRLAIREALRGHTFISADVPGVDHSPSTL